MSVRAASTAPAEQTDEREKSTPSGRLLLRMPRTLHAELARRAEQDGTSLNQFITDALATTVGWGTEKPKPAAAPAGGSSRAVLAALVANAIVIGLAAVAATAVLLYAWLG